MTTRPNDVQSMPPDPKIVAAVVHHPIRHRAQRKTPSGPGDEYYPRAVTGADQHAETRSLFNGIPHHYTPETGEMEGLTVAGPPAESENSLRQQPC